MKTCTACRREKTLSCFSKDKSKSDGHRPDCKSCRSAKNSIYYESNKDTIKEKTKLFHSENKKYYQEYDKNWRKKNKSRIMAHRKHRLETDIIFKLKDILRGRLNKAVKNSYKSGSAVSDLGCSIQHLKLHLELFFGKDMTWNNYGKTGWVIDHIKPLSKFDLSNETQFAEACNFKNLQPLWFSDNLVKGDR
jgi:hypothetical protein